MTDPEVLAARPDTTAPPPADGGSSCGWSKKLLAAEGDGEALLLPALPLVIRACRSVSWPWLA